MYINPTPPIKTHFQRTSTFFSSCFEITNPINGHTLYPNLGIENCSLDEFLKRMSAVKVLPNLPIGHRFVLVPIEKVGLTWKVKDKDFTHLIKGKNAKILASTNLS